MSIEESTTRITRHAGAPVAGSGPWLGRPEAMQPGCPPRLRGGGAQDLLAWATACRASAVVLDRERLGAQAWHLRELADAAERRAAALRQASRSTTIPLARRAA